MKITLTETGGLIGKTKKAAINFDISESKYQALLKQITVLPERGTRSSKDALTYNLAVEGEDEPATISISNIPEEYNELFDQLFSRLKIVRK